MLARGEVVEPTPKTMGKPTSATMWGDSEVSLTYASRRTNPLRCLNIHALA